MKEFAKGMLARSKAGHDAGKLYAVIKADESYVYLADGRLKPMEKLKKKRRRHVQIIYHIPSLLENAIKAGEEFRDEQIRKAIQEYEKNQQEV